MGKNDLGPYLILLTLRELVRAINIKGDQGYIYVHLPSRWHDPERSGPKHEADRSLMQ